MQCLVDKRLTFSDVSITIAKTGRLVLPRSQMQGNISTFLHHGCSPPPGSTTTASTADDTNSQAPSAAAATAAIAISLRLPVNITIYDTAGTAWPMVLKTWQNQVRGEHRPTFVLENSAPFFQFHGIVQGESVRICAATDTTTTTTDGTNSGTNSGGDRLVMGRSTDLPAPPPLQAPPQPVVGFDVVGKVRKNGGGGGRGGGGGSGWNNNGSSSSNHLHNDQGASYPEGNEADGAARALMDLMKHGVPPSGDGNGIDAGNILTITDYNEQRMPVPSKPPFPTSAFAASLTTSKHIIIQPPQPQQHLQQPLPMPGTDSSLPAIINNNNNNNKSTVVTTGDDWGSGTAGTADIGNGVHQRIFTDPAVISINNNNNTSNYIYETDSPRNCLLPWRSRSSTPGDGDDHYIKMMQSMMMNNGISTGNGGGNDGGMQQQQQQHVLMKPVARKGGLYVVTTGVSGRVGVVAAGPQQPPAAVAME